MKSLTFELHNVTTEALGKTFVARIAGQSHSNPTAAQEETNLLTPSILGEEMSQKIIGVCVINKECESHVQLTETAYF